MCYTISSTKQLRCCSIAWLRLKVGMIYGQVPVKFTSLPFIRQAHRFRHPALQVFYRVLPCPWREEELEENKPKGKYASYPLSNLRYSIFIWLPLFSTSAAYNSIKLTFAHDQMLTVISKMNETELLKLLKMHCKIIIFVFSFQVSLGHFYENVLYLWVLTWTSILRISIKK